jgi:hypothetical protein
MPEVVIRRLGKESKKTEGEMGSGEYSLFGKAYHFFSNPISPRSMRPYQLKYVGS